MIAGLLPHEKRRPRRPLFRRASRLVREAGVVLDVGAGIRPQRLVPCRSHICVEPHWQYADRLAAHGYRVLRKTAVEALEALDCRVDTIVALDVIEHMERDEGRRFIALALKRARRQVVIFTPLGFVAQEETGETDAWGLQGQAWQRHLSGWTPEDFAGWRCIVDARFSKRCGAFFAIHG